MVFILIIQNLFFNIFYFNLLMGDNELVNLHLRNSLVMVIDYILQFSFFFKPQVNVFRSGLLYDQIKCFITFKTDLQSVISPIQPYSHILPHISIYQKEKLESLIKMDSYDLLFTLYDKIIMYIPVISMSDYAEVPVKLEFFFLKRRLEYSNITCFRFIST